VFDAILADPRATGVSVFFARKTSDGKDADDIVLVGTTEDGTLLWTDGDVSATSTTSTTYDNGYSCPPYCPK
jgi:hypothetical protein